MILDIVTVPAPLFVSVATCQVDPPITTPPRLTVDGAPVSTYLVAADVLDASKPVVATAIQTKKHVMSCLRICAASFGPIF